MSNPKVDLTLLKRLVAELESALATVDTIKNSLSKVDNVELNVEGSKAAGLAAGIMQESSLLVMDIYTLIGGGAAPKSKNDFIDKLMGGIKGPGGTN
jgi:hypothetical protein